MTFVPSARVSPRLKTGVSKIWPMSWVSSQVPCNMNCNVTDNESAILGPLQCQHVLQARVPHARSIILIRVLNQERISAINTDKCFRRVQDGLHSVDDISRGITGL